MPEPNAPHLQKDGEKILNNYKKQLAEKLAREAAENTNLFSKPSGSSRKGKMGNTMTSFKSKNSNKSQEREAEAQKLI